MKKLYHHILKFLEQGTSPKELAITIALGILIGIFPIYGTATLICTLIAIIFRLNLVVIQLANYLSFPLLIITMIPFYKLGNKIFSNSDFNWDFYELVNFFKADLFKALQELSLAIGYAAITWLIFAPIGFFIFYWISYPIIKRIAVRINSN